VAWRKNQLGIVREKGSFEANKSDNGQRHPLTKTNAVGIVTRNNLAMQKSSQKANHEQQTMPHTFTYLPPSHPILEEPMHFQFEAYAEGPVSSLEQ
jgi:hypothetical protein